MITEYIVPAILSVFLLVLHWFLPSYLQASLPFGVRIPPEREGTPVIAQVKRDYRIGLFISALVVALVCWWLLQVYAFPFIGYAALLLLIVLLGIDYVIAHRRLSRVKTREGWYVGLKQAVVADTQTHHEHSRLTFLLLICSLGLVAAMFLVGVLRYPALPATIPVHFGRDGQPDSWESKQLGVFIVPLTALFLSVLIGALGWYLPNSRQSLDPANPVEDRQHQRMLRLRWSELILLISITANISLFMTSLIIWQIFPSSSSVTISIVVTLLPMLIIVIAALTFVRRRGETQLHSGNQGTGLVYRDDDKYWKGGLLYVNPNDPAIFIEKRFGVGWTLNFGHPIAQVISGIFILIIALLSILRFVLPR